MERRGGDEQEQEDLAKKLSIKGNKKAMFLSFYCLDLLDSYGKCLCCLTMHWLLICAFKSSRFMCGSEINKKLLTFIADVGLSSQKIVLLNKIDPIFLQ